MRTARTELNLTEWVVLGLVCEGPTHGWRIVRAVRPGGPIGAVWSTTGPLVYRAISLLEDAGLVRSVRASGERGPERAILEAEPAGIELIREWLMRPVDHVRDLRTELLLKLLLLDRCGLDRTVLVRRQLDRLRPIGEALATRVAASTGREDFVDLWRASTAEAAFRFLEALLTDLSSSPVSRPVDAG